MGLPDAYVVRARVAPVIVVGIPILALFISNLLTGTELKNLAVIGIVGITAITLIAQLGRDLGKKIEQALYEEWNGKPTTVMLRHSNDRIDSITKARLHNRLSEKVPNLHLPNSDEENSNPQQADIIYDSAVLWLRSNTQDNSKFLRLHEENISYGFRRNLLGLKLLGLFLAFGIVIVKILVDRPFSLEKISSFVLEPEIIASVFLIAFLSLIVTKNWVKYAAESYAFALFNAAESI
ncbi:hypothetical protein H6F90_12270 [Trichocoleus sp. FACHB-591]|uniref:hypothetical protein n=1 Tax=Trichocoleus sp. FACHB-591 TaxID=2692872 RepID=UPI001686BE1E|nr:hypothetical protein [Trichocoleus sp. FACHB-591]MBD2095923.1 hypothetical protein [Trichocoleus sp. FACHB-591]